MQRNFCCKFATDSPLQSCNGNSLANLQRLFRCKLATEIPLRLCNGVFVATLQRSFRCKSICSHRFATECIRCKIRCKCKFATATLLVCNGCFRCKLPHFFVVTVQIKSLLPSRMTIITLPLNNSFTANILPEINVSNKTNRLSILDSYIKVKRSIIQESEENLARFFHRARQFHRIY